MSYEIIFNDPPYNYRLKNSRVDYAIGLSSLYANVYQKNVDVKKQAKWFYENPIEPVTEVFLVHKEKLIWI